MLTETLEYAHGETTCEGGVCYDKTATTRRPCVIVLHAWHGAGEHETAKAKQLAELGYVGFVADVYGKGVRGDPAGDNSALMGPFMADRAALRERLLAAVAAARAHPAVDPERIAAIGYCFGGLGALDLARAGAPGVRGVVSFHGLFTPPDLGPQAPISAKVLVCHGWADPMAKPDAVLALATELTEAGADWQVHAYGHALHAFTHEGANAPAQGVAYDPKAARRSWRAAVDLLEEVFA
jgi:dienelactone hydrolase